MKLCRYHANRALKTGDHQAHNPAVTNGTTSRRNDNSRYRQRRKKIPCSQWEKETKTTMIWQRNYQSIKSNFIKISCTFQWCIYNSKIGCEYHANRTPKNKRSSSWQPYRWHRNLSNDKSRSQQRRKGRQLDDPMLSMRKGKEYYNDIRYLFRQNKTKIQKYHVHFSEETISV